MEEQRLFPESAVEERIGRLPPEEQPKARLHYRRAKAAAEVEGLPFIAGIVLMIGGLRTVTALDAHWSIGAAVIVCSLAAAIAVHRLFSKPAGEVMVGMLRQDLAESPEQRSALADAAIDDAKIRPVAARALKKE